MTRSYPALRVLSGFLSFMGYFILVVCIATFIVFELLALSAVYAAVSVAPSLLLPAYLLINVLLPFGVLFGGIFQALGLIAVSELINVFLNIEQNTHTTNLLLSQRFERHEPPRERYPGTPPPSTWDDPHKLTRLGEKPAPRSPKPNGKTPETGSSPASRPVRHQRAGKWDMGSS